MAKLGFIYNANSVVTGVADLWWAVYSECEVTIVQRRENFTVITGSQYSSCHRDTDPDLETNVLSALTLGLWNL